MNYRVMNEEDIERVVTLYINYYNQYEDGVWTLETAYKRIHQVWSREDSFCMLLEDGAEIAGFVMGYFEQYDDIQAYDLIEIVLAYPYQNRGIGTKFMREVERRVKEQGASLIQLESVNDEKHENFYGKLGYRTAVNFVLKTKVI